MTVDIQLYLHFYMFRNLDMGNGSKFCKYTQTLKSTDTFIFYHKKVYFHVSCQRKTNIQFFSKAFQTKVFDGFISKSDSSKILH